MNNCLISGVLYQTQLNSVLLLLSPHEAFLFTGQTLQALYLFGASVMTFISLVLQLHPSFLSSHWAKRRLLVFCSLVAYGVMPSVHWIYLQGGMDQDIVGVRAFDDIIPSLSTSEFLF